MKVLRSHIESIPVPVADEGIQRDIISKTERIVAENLTIYGERLDKTEHLRHILYDELDDIVRKLYAVTDDEYGFIKQTLSGDKYML